MREQGDLLSAIARLERVVSEQIEGGGQLVFLGRGASVSTE